MTRISIITNILAHLMHINHKNYTVSQIVNALATIFKYTHLCCCQRTSRNTIIAELLLSLWTMDTVPYKSTNIKIFKQWLWSSTYFEYAISSEMIWNFETIDNSSGLLFLHIVTWVFERTRRTLQHIPRWQYESKSRLSSRVFFFPSLTLLLYRCWKIIMF